MQLVLVGEDYGPFAANIVGSVLDFGQEFRARYSYSPESGSQADLEINHSQERATDGSPWSAEQAMRPYDLAGGLLVTAIGHYLGSLQSLLLPEMTLFGFQAVTRSAIEGATRAAWVLDPTVSARQRMVRDLLLELQSMEEARLVELAAGGDGSNYVQQMFELRVRLATLGIDEYYGKKNASPPGSLRRRKPIGFDGQVLPTMTDAVAAFLPHIGVAHGEMCYRALAGVSHSLLLGVTTYLTGVRIEGSATRVIPTPKLPIYPIANAVAISIAGYLAVVERHALLWGRDAAGVKAKRLGAVGELLSAIKQPEHRIA